MLSGAETELLGTEQGAEEALKQGAEQGTDRTGEGVEQWQDLNPDEFDPTLRDQVVKLNKAAVTQFQNKVKKLAEQGKLTEGKLKEIEEKYDGAKTVFQQFVEDPEKFLDWHRQKRPDYWQGRVNQGQEGLTAQDKQAVEALRKAGLLVSDDMKERDQKLNYLIQLYEEQQTASAAQDLAAQEKWCKEKKLPWSEKHAQACIALIRSKDAATLQEAYEQLFKSAIDSANQDGLLRKKNAQDLKPEGKADGKYKDESLDDIVADVVGSQGD